MINFFSDQWSVLRDQCLVIRFQCSVVIELLLLLLLLISVFQIGFAHILVVYKTLESLYLGILMVFVLS